MEKNKRKKFNCDERNQNICCFDGREGPEQRHLHGAVEWTHQNLAQEIRMAEGGDEGILI